MSGGLTDDDLARLRRLGITPKMAAFIASENVPPGSTPATGAEYLRGASDNELLDELRRLERRLDTGRRAASSGALRITHNPSSRSLH